MVHTYQKEKTKHNAFFKYNKHINYENFCRAKLLLHVPFDQSEDTLKHNLPTWQVAIYTFYESTIQTNEPKFTCTTSTQHGVI